MRDANVMRQLGTVIRTQSTEKIPLEGSDASFTWLDEGGAYGDSIPNFGQMQIDAYKAGGIIKLSEEILADAFINIEEYVTKKIVTGMTELQETAFMTGDGTKKPTGIVTGSALGKTTAVAQLLKKSVYMKKH
jgi:HK97 family phage major capsid protein